MSISISKEGIIGSFAVVAAVITTSQAASAICRNSGQPDGASCAYSQITQPLVRPVISTGQSFMRRVLN